MAEMPLQPRRKPREEEPELREEEAELREEEPGVEESPEHDMQKDAEPLENDEKDSVVDLPEEGLDLSDTANTSLAVAPPETDLDEVSHSDEQRDDVRDESAGDKASDVAATGERNTEEIESRLAVVGESLRPLESALASQENRLREIDAATEAIGRNTALLQATADNLVRTIGHVETSIDQTVRQGTQRLDQHCEVLLEQLEEHTEKTDVLSVLNAKIADEDDPARLAKLIGLRRAALKHLDESESRRMERELKRREPGIAQARESREFLYRFAMSFLATGGGLLLATTGGPSGIAYFMIGAGLYNLAPPLVKLVFSRYKGRS